MKIQSAGLTITIHPVCVCARGRLWLPSTFWWTTTLNRNYFLSVVTVSSCLLAQIKKSTVPHLYSFKCTIFYDIVQASNASKDSTFCSLFIITLQNHCTFSQFVSIHFSIRSEYLCCSACPSHPIMHSCGYPGSLETLVRQRKERREAKRKMWRRNGVVITVLMGPSCSDWRTREGFKIAERGVTLF